MSDGKNKKAPKQKAITSIDELHDHRQPHGPNPDHEDLKRALGSREQDIEQLEDALGLRPRRPQEPPPVFVFQAPWHKRFLKKAHDRLLKIGKVAAAVRAIILLALLLAGLFSLKQCSTTKTSELVKDLIHQ